MKGEKEIKEEIKGTKEGGKKRKKERERRRKKKREEEEKEGKERTSIYLFFSSRDFLSRSSLL